MVFPRRDQRMIRSKEDKIIGWWEKDVKKRMIIWNKQWGIKMRKNFNIKLNNKWESLSTALHNQEESFSNISIS